MKTIIKPGKKTYKTTCEQCGCEFTYQDEDEIEEKGDMFINGGGNRQIFKVFVKCPFCNNKIFLRGTK